MATMKTLNGYGFNATELNGKTSDSYLLKTDTVANSADSQKLGGKAPKYYIQPRNLLDNSWWGNRAEIINQRGETSKQGDWVYWIDRWLVNASNAAISLVDGGIRVPAQVDKNLRLVQRVPLEKIQKGRDYTIAVCESDGTVRCASGIYNDIINGDGNGDNLLYVSLQDGDGSTFYYVIVDCYKDVVLKWAALYEGSYTADTLPPYVPKGYAAELAECRRYYKRFTSPYAGIINVGHVTGSTKCIYINPPDNYPMRINKPSFAFTGIITVRGINGYIAEDYRDAVITVYADATGCISSLEITRGDSAAWNTTNNTPVAVQFHANSVLELIADL